MSASLSGNNLSVSLNKYGKHTLNITNTKGEILNTTVMEKFPEKILSNPPTKSLYIGETFSLRKEYDSDEYIVSVSNSNIVKILDNGEISGKNEGSSVVYIEHPGLNLKDSVSVEVDKVRITAWMNSYLPWSSSFSVDLMVVVEGDNITKATYATCDYNNAVVLPQYKITREYENGARRSTYDPQIYIYARSYSELEEKLKNVKVEFYGIVNGTEVRKEISILPQKPR